MLEARPIRFLASLLIALLLAVSVGTAGWAALVALQRPATVAQPLPAIAPIVPPALPSRLPAAAEFERNTLPAAARRTQPSATVRVHIPAVPAALRNGQSGVAVFDAATGADFVWTPIDAAAIDADGAVTVAIVTRVRGELTVAVAAAAEWARHGYLARTSVTIDGPTGREIAVELPVAIGEVSLALPDGAPAPGPLRLSRCDDPFWLPTFLSATGLQVAPGEPVHLLLGAGCYELIDPIDAERRQGFDVPAAHPVVISAPLIPARVDRP